MKHTRLSALSCLFIVLTLASLACSLPSSATTQSPPGLEETRIALGVEQTALAGEKAIHQTQDAAPAATAALPSDTPAPPAATATQASSPTEQPSPTAASSATPVPSPTLAPSPTSVDIQAKIKAANVLVFEDMMGNYSRKPIVHQVINEMRFSGGRVIEVGDALGRFKEMLLNTTDWDLIIIAAEYRTAVQGEFWQYVYDQVDRGAAVILEVWYLDRHYTDIQPLLSKCGLEFQKNWTRGTKYNLEDYAIYWLQPEHPFFQPPQEPISLANPNYLYWIPPLSDDAGDLLRLA